MAEQPNHLLTTMGVLQSFSISKKITQEEVNTMLKTAKSKTKDNKEILDLVRTKIMKEIIDATNKGTLPGILLEKSDQHAIPIQHVEALNHMVLVISQKLKTKKIDKLSLCYFINYLVGSLQLNEEDFEDFHRRIKDHGDGDGDEDEGDDGELI